MLVDIVPNKNEILCFVSAEFSCFDGKCSCFFMFKWGMDDLVKKF